MPSSWLSLPPIFLLPAAISAVTLDCTKILIDKQEFNLEKLGGPKTVHNVRYAAPSIVNTTFTIDICSPIAKEKGTSSKDQCFTGTRVCAKEYDYDASGKEFLSHVIPIAGEFATSHGRHLDPHYTRLKDSASHPDQEGVLIELNGGRYPDAKDGTPQKAIVKFLCDREMSGLEGFDEEERKLDVLSYGEMGRRAEDEKEDGGDEDTPDLPDLDKGKALQFVSYKMEGDTKVLRLDWKTKYACEGAADGKDPKDDEPKKSGGWGFFTWFLITLFLLAAAYIIFGSWLNYNRYGARGWDLIPHGDTIRDIPYIVKDWTGNVVSRFKGGNSRGGYSAV